MVFENKVYDVLKWIAMYLLPAVGTLYFALARIWGLSYGEEIVGTITAVDAFLGVLLGISHACYQGDGKLILNGEEDGDEIEVDSDIDLANGKKIMLKVERGS